MKTTASRKRSIRYGDRVFARITQNGKTIYNFVTERVGSMTEFIAEVRRTLKGIRGLVMLHIRNYNEGWGEERPLMLYAPKSAMMYGYEAVVESPAKMGATAPAQGRMLFPWETH